VIEAPENGITHSEEKHVQLGKYLESHRGDRHLVVLQDYPDPDAISSALAYRLIAGQYGIKTSMIYSGKISHQENIALVRLLNVPLTSFDDSFDLSPFRGAVFVDNQGTTSHRIVDALEQAGMPILVVIDHHQPQTRLSAEFSDIRRTGATATIFSEYMKAGLLEMDPANKEHVHTATALLHGIMTDTGNFSRAREDDFKAAAYLSRFRDSGLLRQILYQSRSKQSMEVIRRSVENRVIGGSFSIAGVGYLREEDRDMIPQAADFLLTEENIHTAIAYGIVTSEGQNEKLVGSLRTSKMTIDPDEFIKDVLGKDARGHYFGGGKLSAGGFEIPVGFLSGGDVDGYQEIKWQVFDNQLKLKFFNKIGHTPKSGG
jgi:nanoRNase/pAp phosphatase (c-di-AMP/oligoRNAs hydrolase)